MDAAGCTVQSETCSVCSRGSRTDGYVCVPCQPTPAAPYDVAYLAFWLLVVASSHALAIYATPRFSTRVRVPLAPPPVQRGPVPVGRRRGGRGRPVGLALCGPSRGPGGATEMAGSLELGLCATDSIDDWYTTFFNPATYGGPIYCASEAVYPRWSLVFLFLAYSVGCLLLLRVPISARLCDGDGRSSILGALFYVPIYAIICNAIFGGVIYYAFPYLVLVVATVMQYLALWKRRQFGILRMRTTDLVLFGTIRYLFMGYGIVSLFFFFMQDNLNAIAVSITGVFGPFVLILACYVVDLSIRRINEQQRWRRRRRRARPV